jgi:hypothetical protein
MENSPSDRPTLAPVVAGGSPTDRPPEIAAKEPGRQWVGITLRNGRAQPLGPAMPGDTRGPSERSRR